MLQALTREIKNTQYEGIEAQIRDATCNSETEASAELLEKIRSGMCDRAQYRLAWLILWKRIRDTGYPRHVLKGLNLLDFVLRVNPPSTRTQSWLVASLREAEQVSYLNALAQSHANSLVRELATKIRQFVLEFKDPIDYVSEAPNNVVNIHMRASPATPAYVPNGVAASSFSHNNHDPSYSEPIILAPHQQLHLPPHQQSFVLPVVAPASEHSPYRAYGISQPTVHQPPAYTPNDRPAGMVIAQPANLSGAARAATTKVGGWVCAACTYENERGASNCAMCSAVPVAIPSSSSFPPSASSAPSSSAIASSVPAFRQGIPVAAPIQKSWECKKCRWPNTAGHDRCAMCGAFPTHGEQQKVWVCQQCTFANSSDRDQCGICRQPKVFVYGNNNNHNNNNNLSDGMARKVALGDGNKKNKKSSISINNSSQKIASSNTGWTCDSCTFTNKNDDLQCGVCNAPRRSHGISLEVMQGWLAVEDESGRIVFENMKTGQRTTKDPRPLPAGWSESIDQRINQVFYLNNNDRTTTWVDPRPKIHLAPNNNNNNNNNASMQKRLSASDEKKALNNGREEEKAVISKDWSCAQCSYLNSEGQVRCGICEAAAPPVKAATASSRLPDLVSPLPQQRKEIMGGWECDQCSFINMSPHFQQKCEMCTRLRSAIPSSASAVASSSSASVSSSASASSSASSDASLVDLRQRFKRQSTLTRNPDNSIANNCWECTFCCCANEPDLTHCRLCFTARGGGNVSSGNAFRSICPRCLNESSSPVCAVCGESVPEEHPVAIIAPSKVSKHRSSNKSSSGGGSGGKKAKEITPFDQFLSPQQLKIEKVPEWLCPGCQKLSEESVCPLCGDQKAPKNQPVPLEKIVAAPLSNPKAFSGDSWQCKFCEVMNKATLGACRICSKSRHIAAVDENDGEDSESSAAPSSPSTVGDNQRRGIPIEDFDPFMEEERGGENQRLHVERDLYDRPPPPIIDGWQHTLPPSYHEQQQQPFIQQLQQQQQQQQHLFLESSQRQPSDSLQVSSRPRASSFDKGEHNTAIIPNLRGTSPNRPPPARPRTGSVDSVGGGEPKMFSSPAERRASEVSEARGSVSSLHAPEGEGNNMLHTPRHGEKERIRAEILETEETYVFSLTRFRQLFIQPLNQNYKSFGLRNQQAKDICSDISVICRLHTLLLEDFRKQDIIEVFIKYADFLKIYTTYVNNYERTLATINYARNNVNFNKFLADIQASDNISPPAFFILPVQRIPRYCLLLRELQKHTSENTPAYKRVGLALEKLKAIATTINEQKRLFENKSKLLEIQTKITSPTQYVVAKNCRLFIREGKLKSLEDDKVYFFFLFNDALLQVSDKYRVVSEMELGDILVRPGAAQDFSILCKGAAGTITERHYLADLPAEKDAWVAEINLALDAHHNK